MNSYYLHTLLRWVTISALVVFHTDDATACIYSANVRLDKNLFYHEQINATAPRTNQFLLFSHGLLCSEHCSGAATSSIPLPCYSFNYPDGDKNPIPSSLGQENEMEALSDALIHAKNNFSIANSLPHEKVKIIGFGVSRGASNWITTLSILSNDHLSAIDALILESPFDSMLALSRDLMSMSIVLSYLPGGQQLSQKIIKKIAKNHNFLGISPLVAVKKITRKDIPILIICSKTDALIPWQRSARLYLELVKAGHSNVHLLMLNKGEHGFLHKCKEYKHSIYQFYIQPHRAPTPLLATSLVYSTQLPETTNMLEYYLANSRVRPTWVQWKYIIKMAYNFILHTYY
jgi:hypothetical protein